MPSWLKIFATIVIDCNGSGINLFGKKIHGFVAHYFQLLTSIITLNYRNMVTYEESKSQS